MHSESDVQQPAPQASAPPANGTLGLGEKCSSPAECANGADCYSTNSGLMTLCGNFQSRCSSDSQCAYNTCVDGLCNGFIPSTTTTSSAQATGTPTIVYLPLGADCSPESTPCANGSSCYATNSMLQPRCGNFQASCSNDSQCAFNTCNQGLCNGFLASTTTVLSTSTQATSYPASSPPASSTASSAQSTSTSTTVYLPLGADCSPDSTPCANDAQCYATNSMLQPRCGNFQSACTTDAQCAFNTCNQGFCNGFLASSSSSLASVTYSASSTESSSVAASAVPSANTSILIGSSSTPAATPYSMATSPPQQSTAIVVTTPVVTESSVVVVTPTAIGGSSPSSSPSTSAMVQVDNSAPATRSGPLGLIVAGIFAMIAFV